MLRIRISSLIATNLVCSTCNTVILCESNVCHYTHQQCYNNLFYQLTTLWSFCYELTWFKCSQIPVSDEFIVGRGSRPSSAAKKAERPASGKKMIMAPANTTSISAYIQLKRSGKLNMEDHPKCKKSCPVKLLY